MDNYVEIAKDITKTPSRRVYLAGGWFTPEQEKDLEDMRSVLLEEGFQIFDPKNEALVQEDSSVDWRRQVFEGNINAIDGALFMVATTCNKDMGTIMECGVAYAKKVPIIYFAQFLGNNPFNIMLAQSGVAVAKSKDELRALLNDEELMRSIVYNIPYSVDYIGKVE